MPESKFCEQPIAEQEVVIWTASLLASQDVLAVYASLLTLEEAAQAASFRYQHLRDSYVVAHGTTRQMLSAILGLDAQEIEISHGKNGKPELPPSSGLHFNLAHSGEFMALAVTRMASVGVDIEQVRSMSDTRSLAEAFFAREECDQLPCAEPGLSAGFFRCWTLKEAFLKSTGEGLSRSLDSFAVRFNDIARTGLLRICNPSDDPAKWTLQSFEVRPGYIGALAIRATSVKVRHEFWDHAVDDPRHPEEEPVHRQRISSAQIE